jgi:hypothetical protein
VRPGDFVAVIQLEQVATCQPVSVKVHPHTASRGAPLWVAEAAPAPGVWQAMTEMSSKVLSHYRSRALASAARYPGAQVGAVRTRDPMPTQL